MTSTTDRTAARSSVVPRKVPASATKRPTRKAPPTKRSPRRPAAPEQSPWLPGSIAAAWALGAGLVAITLPVLLIWAADGRSGADSVEATRTAGQLWLLAHGTSLAVPGGALGLTPLGLTLLPLALLHRAGRHGVRQLAVGDTLQAAQLIGAIALPYAVVAAALTAVTATDALQPEPLRALPGALVVALVGAGSGVLREAGLRRELDRVPDLVRRLCSAAMAAVLVLLAAGALLVVVSLLMHHSRVASLSGATGPGLVGGAGLVVLQLLYAPNAVMWGASWLTGPGFAVGVGTSVSPWAHTLGQVPALPVLGALPSAEAPVPLAVVSLLVPLAAGVLGGVLLSRRLPRGSVRRAALEGALVGVAAGLMMLALAFVSGGPLGGGRLVAMGPSAWQVALATAVQVGAWCAATTSLLRWRHGS